MSGPIRERMPEAETCAIAEESGGMVGGEAGTESCARFAGDAHLAEGGLAGGAGLKMRFGEEELAARHSTRDAGFAIREAAEVGHRLNTDGNPRLSESVKTVCGSSSH